MIVVHLVARLLLERLLQHERLSSGDSATETDLGEGDFPELMDVDSQSFQSSSSSSSSSSTESEHERSRVKQHKPSPSM